MQQSDSNSDSQSDNVSNSSSESLHTVEKNVNEKLSDAAEMKENDFNELKKVKAAIKAGADINWMNPEKEGMTCLMRACSVEHNQVTDIVSYLLKQPNLDINKQSYDGSTALMFAIWRNTSRMHSGYNRDLIPMLLNHQNIDLNIEKYDAKKGGKTVREIVSNIWEESEESDKIRVMFGFPPVKDFIEFVRTNGNSGWDGTAKYMASLFSQGIDPNTTENEYGRNVLMSALRMQHEHVVRLLLAQPGIKLDSVDHYGWTVLHWACAPENTRIPDPGCEEITITLINCLFEAGAASCIPVKNGDGATPLDLARSEGKIIPGEDLKLVEKLFRKYDPNSGPEETGCCIII